jgi:hypothetical protein
MAVEYDHFAKNSGFSQSLAFYNTKVQILSCNVVGIVCNGTSGAVFYFSGCKNATLFRCFIQENVHPSIPIILCSATTVYLMECCVEAFTPTYGIVVSALYSFGTLSLILSASGECATEALPGGDVPRCTLLLRSKFVLVPLLIFLDRGRAASFVFSSAVHRF